MHQNKRLTVEWLAKHYEERVRLAPSWIAKELKQTVWAELRLNVSEKTCRKALLACKLSIEGDFKDHFKRLRDYAAEFKRANENNSVYPRLQEGTNIFHSIYICFNALKKGWKAGCRPVIGIDGCFLKGILEGKILSVVGVDGNNQMYPIAWVVVPRETQETWTWFLLYLITDLELNCGQGLTVIPCVHAICAIWQLTGIPCVHAICAIWQVRDEPKNYVSDWYRKAAYLRAYDQWIEMFNGPNEWPRQRKPKVECPPLRVWKGMPRFKRRREVGESAATGSKFSRKGQKQVCRSCGVIGHNRKTCTRRQSGPSTNVPERGENAVGSQISVPVNASQPDVVWSTQESQTFM